MLDNLLILLKAGIKSKIGKNNIKNLIKNNKATFIALIFVFLYLEGVVLAQSILLAKMGLGEYIPVLTFTMIISISLVSSFLKAGDEIYNFKNKDILLTYPIKVLDIVQSRMMLMYLLNVLISLFIAIPFLITYSIFVRFSFVITVDWLLLAVITPIIPICISVIINTIFGKIASKFKGNNYINNILVLGITIIVLAISLYYSFKLSKTEMDILDIGNITGRFLDILIKYIIPIKWIDNIFRYKSVVSLLIYLVISILAYLMTILYVSSKYIDINFGIKSNNKKSIELNNKKLSKKTVLKSLYIKELKTYMGSRMYAMNTFIGSLLLLMFSIFIMIVKVENISNLVGMNIELMAVKLYPHIAGVMIAMACTTHVSISFEGRRIWFVKSSPIGKKDFYNSKILVYFTITFPAIVIFIISEIVNGFRAIEILTSFILIVSYMVFIGILGIRVNLRFLKYDWENETKLIKQSINQFIVVLVAFVGIGIPIGGIVLFSKYANIINLFTTSILLILAYNLYKKSLKLNF